MGTLSTFEKSGKVEAGWPQNPDGRVCQIGQLGAVVVIQTTPASSEAERTDICQSLLFHSALLHNPHTLSLSENTVHSHP